MFLPLVPGQELAKRYFRRALEVGRLSHAYLFLGPDGAGKRLFARELAKALFCDAGLACGTCLPCQSVAHGNHPAVDIHGPAEGKTVIDIDTVRSLCARSHYKSSTVVVAVLEQAELLSEPAANALLKTLEEPPGEMILILTAQSAGSLLPTIVSRCHRILFTGPSSGTLEEDAGILERVAEVSAPGFFAAVDLREWLSELVPGELGTSRLKVRRLLDSLVRRARELTGGKPGASVDPPLRSLVRLLELRHDLDRNVNPDLVLELVLSELRRES